MSDAVSSDLVPLIYISLHIRMEVCATWKQTVQSAVNVCAGCPFSCLILLPGLLVSSSCFAQNCWLLDSCNCNVPLLAVEAIGDAVSIIIFMVNYTVSCVCGDSSDPVTLAAVLIRGCTKAVKIRTQGVLVYSFEKWGDTVWR